MLPMKAGLPAQALRIVPYLHPEEVQKLCAGCRGRQRDRDALLILVLFQTGLRISEALGLTVGHLSRQPGALEIVGKGGKPRLVACPAALSHRLKAYAFDRGLGPADRSSRWGASGPGRSSGPRLRRPGWGNAFTLTSSGTPGPSSASARPATPGPCSCTWATPARS
jgi:integrase/recombinase XerD